MRDARKQNNNFNFSEASARTVSRNSFLGRFCSLCAVLLLGACGEGFFDSEPEVYQYAFSLSASLDDLRADIGLDSDNLGWVVEPFETKHSSFNRVSFMMDAEGELLVDIRVSEDNKQSWSTWIPADVVRVGDSFMHNGSVDLPYGGTHIQLRLRMHEPDALKFIRIKAFELAEDFDQDVCPDDSLDIHHQALVADNIDVVKRADWGARRHRCSARQTINSIAIHHTTNPDTPATNFSARMRNIQAYHMDDPQRKYCDIGYHFMVGQDGKIYQGRPEGLRGAHVGGQNTGKIGIAFAGNFNNRAPSRTMLETGARLIAQVSCEYGIPLNRRNVRGHKEFPRTSTDCPGRSFVPLLDQLVADAAALGCENLGQPPIQSGTSDSGQTDNSDSDDTNNQQEQVAPPPSPSDRMVQGIIYRAGSTASRIPGAVVTAAGRSAITNQNGYYTIRVPRGTHSFTAEADGFQTGSIQSTISSVSNSWASIPLRPGQPSVGNGQIEGVVYHAPDMSNTLTGVSVELSNGQSTRTNSQGVFSFDAPAGNYTLTASLSGYQSESTSAQVQTGQSVSAQIGLLQTEDRGVLQGVVYENPNQSRRLSGATVYLSTGQRTTTNSSGHYYFRVAPGTYSITAENGNYADNTIVTTLLANDNQWNNIGLKLDIQDSGSVIGVIYAMPLSSHRLPNTRVFTNTGHSTVANENGVYTFDRLPVGVVSIYAYSDGFINGLNEVNVRKNQRVWGSIGLLPGGARAQTGITSIGPINGEVVDSNPEFVWNNVEAHVSGSVSFNYRVVITDPEGKNTFEASVNGSIGGRTNTRLNLALPSGKWLWTVYALSDDGRRLASSAMQEFEVR